jgi:osmoprotectant transport system permease protein
MVMILMLVTACGGDTAVEGDRQKIVFATDHEFSVRDDGLPGLYETYGFEFDEVVMMDMGITYEALRDNEVQAAMGFATDGRITAYDLVNLVDDKQFFPVYNAAVVVREDTLNEYPQIADVLNPIAPLLDDETMASLNAKVDMEGMEPEEAARQFLEENNLLPGKIVDGGTLSVGSKEFTEQLILGKMAIIALEDAGFTVEDNTGLGGSTVARSALEEGAIDLYWEYTGTAWITHLGHDNPITDPQECYQAVKEEDAQNGLVWLDYAPLNNTYTIMLRRDMAEELGIETISDLAAYLNQ